MSEVNPPKTFQVYDRSFALKKQGRIALLYSIQGWSGTRYGVYKFSEFPYVECKGHVWTTRKVRSAYFFNKWVFETYQRALIKFDKIEQEFKDELAKPPPHRCTKNEEIKSRTIITQIKVKDRQQKKRRRRSDETGQLRLFQDDI
jgi:hypothetical protein